MINIPSKEEPKKLFKCLACDEINAEEVEIKGRTFRICNSCGTKLPITRGNRVQAVYPKNRLAGESTAEFYFVEGA